jgi:3-dehydroquinate synthase
MSAGRKSRTGKTVRSVKLPLPGRENRSYQIQIGAGAIEKIGNWLRRAAPKSSSRFAVIIADERLVDARAALLASLTSAGWTTHEIPVAAGEGLKNFETIYPLYGDLIKKKAGRDAVLFALGGGSVGDAAGFIAATYLRGIRWVGVPTTLLAQVDSSVGGKTGINHPLGKNLIGAFHQPTLVVCDTDFLLTLSQREMVSGFGETVKYGLIYDPEFYDWLEQNADDFLGRNSDALVHAIERSLAWKAKAVSRDELDRKGVREALNFGHTFGHALEAITEYGTYQHGEAVLWGMRFALALSRVRGHLKTSEFLRAERFLSTLPVPPLPTQLGQARYYEKMIDKMFNDKKVRDGKIHFVLLKKLGKTVSDSEVKRKDIDAAYHLMTSELELAP